jgi:hypothetical protein
VASQYVNVQYNGATSKNGTIKNCVFDVTYTDAQGKVTMNGSTDNRINVFTVGNTTDTLCTNYENVVEFVSAQSANITATNGWNMDVWSVKDGKLYFGTALVG